MLYRIKLCGLACERASYPEGSFGGKELLDGPINLSPLYPSPMAMGPQQTPTRFLWLGCAQAKFISFPGIKCALMLYLSGRREGRVVSPKPTGEASGSHLRLGQRPPSPSLHPSGFRGSPWLAHLVVPLVLHRGHAYVYMVLI